jgi:endonuclease/exonuclease/phosphatase family metal-dependent hydrolase
MMRDVVLSRLRIPRRARARRRGPDLELVELGPHTPCVELSHALTPHFEGLRRVRTRRRLRRHRLYRRLQADIERVLAGFEWDVSALPRARALADDAPLRAVAWNVERGKRFAALMGVVQNEPWLRDADLLLLTEVDIGMGRSGNRNVPREVARALDMGYVFANYHLVLAPGDSAEQEHGEHNTLGLHGAALLTRLPVRRFWGLPLPEFTDKFHALEKRLGSKRALLVELELADGPLLVVVVHLDPFAPPRHRAAQLRLVCEAIARTGIERVLLGGDLNTNTYHLGSKAGLALDVLHKLVRFGFDGTVRQYMTPEQVFERRVFAALAQAGLRTEGFTDPTAGTLHYDLNDPELRDKSLAYLPPRVLAWLERKLQPWGGCVPMRIDHFAGRGLSAVRALTLPRARHEGQHVSDHAPIVVEFRP